MDNGIDGQAGRRDDGEGASAERVDNGNRAGTIASGNPGAPAGGPAYDRAWMSGLLILDRTDRLEAADPLHAFALDELLCRAAGAGGPAICHLWRHPRAFVMGLRDSRLPRAREAAERLAGLGYGVAVRNSGGAAVPLDPGVVNLSLILPKDRAEDMAFHGDFERMYDLIRLAVRQLGGEAAKGEVVGSYCPGDFDLSIGGPQVLRHRPAQAGEVLQRAGFRDRRRRRRRAGGRRTRVLQAGCRRRRSVRLPGRRRRSDGEPRRAD
ncbi:lipoyl protein ligase domain-containing protein [Cohnella rhizosphaerae]|uniref:lipoyl protein ligase domain-containing protein n=1 Tax=Cohnella rhizosphaerae TaxID=1457232 RepID=UPI0030B87F9E